MGWSDATDPSPRPKRCTFTAADSSSPRARTPRRVRRRDRRPLRRTRRCHLCPSGRRVVGPAAHHPLPALSAAEARPTVTAVGAGERPVRNGTSTHLVGAPLRALLRSGTGTGVARLLDDGVYLCSISTMYRLADPTSRTTTPTAKQRSRPSSTVRRSPDHSDRSRTPGRSARRSSATTTTNTATAASAYTRQRRCTTTPPPRSEPTGLAHYDTVYEANPERFRDRRR